MVTRENPNYPSLLEYFPLLHLILRIFPYIRRFMADIGSEDRGCLSAFFLRVGRTNSRIFLIPGNNDGTFAVI